jgi:hypothetical protein
MDRASYWIQQSNVSGNSDVACNSARAVHTLSGHGALALIMATYIPYLEWITISH